MLHGDVVASARAVVGLALVAFVPGYLWSLLIWDDLDRATRGFYAVVLSLGLVMVSVFLLNFYLAMPINLLTSLLVVVSLSALPVGLLARSRIEAALGAFGGDERP